MRKILADVYSYLNHFRMFSVRDTDAMLRTYLNDDNMPYLSEIAKTTSLIFVNTHYSLSGSRPATPALIEIGGIHIKAPKPLDSVSKQ